MSHRESFENAQNSPGRTGPALARRTREHRRTVTFVGGSALALVGAGAVAASACPIPGRPTPPPSQSDPQSPPQSPPKSPPPASPPVRTPGPGPADPGGDAGTGTFTGQAAKMQYGTVQVQITAENGKIVAAKALQAPDDNPTSTSINKMAIPKLNQEAIAAGSAKIDAVSGATYTSSAYKESLQSALDKMRA